MGCSFREATKASHAPQEHDMHIRLGLEPIAYEIMTSKMRDRLQAQRTNEDPVVRTKGRTISGRINNAVRNPKFENLDAESKLDLIDGLMSDKHVTTWDFYFGDSWAKRIEQMQALKKSEAEARHNTKPTLTLVASDGSAKEPKQAPRRRAAAKKVATA